MILHEYCWEFLMLSWDYSMASNSSRSFVSSPICFSCSFIILSILLHKIFLCRPFSLKYVSAPSLSSSYIFRFSGSLCLLYVHDRFLWLMPHSWAICLSLIKRQTWIFFYCSFRLLVLDNQLCALCN